MAKNSNLAAAKKAKNDEFYTQITDIEKELVHYKDQLRGKIIFCNCDDPEWSNFWRYFDLNFDPTALELWSYFRSVIDWVNSLFGEHYRKRLMLGLPWGVYYNRYSQNQYAPVALEVRIAELEQDEDITNQKGIYEYVLSGEKDEKLLHIRAFSDKDKRRKYAEQGGVCPMCGQHFDYEKMDGDHILPWAKGGHTEYGNLQMLCIKCNRSNHK